MFCNCNQSIYLLVFTIYAQLVTWKQHFTNPPNENTSFYTISPANTSGHDMDPIKLVSPTEQIVKNQVLVKTRKGRNPQQIIKPETIVKRSTATNNVNLRK